MVKFYKSLKDQVLNTMGRRSLDNPVAKSDFFTAQKSHRYVNLTLTSEKLSAEIMFLNIICMLLKKLRVNKVTDSGILSSQIDAFDQITLLHSTI